MTIQKALRDKVAAFETQKAAALALKITPQYLSDLLAGRREMSDTIAGRLGFRRQFVRTKR